MSFHYEIRLSGSGGQGLVLAGHILAEAAALYDGNNATQSQSYGPEARGGASRSEVIISDGDIDYPKATNVDLMLALTQQACNKYVADLRRGGILLVDAEEVTNLPHGDYKIYAAPITKIAELEVGKKVVTNMVALGLITELSQVVTTTAVEQAIRKRVPKGTEEINLKAFHKGRAAALKLQNNSFNSNGAENVSFVSEVEAPVSLE
ncbi:2-oxoacid:acceptor oxidoreductase family protein [candidate division KSB1 bacterium]|nr:2-oxoacid:acceptor oxidoreductase family protein [candidate division KSB1 bacterium]